MIETKEQYERIFRLDQFEGYLEIDQLRELIEALREVARPLRRFDLQGAMSWAKVIIEEWEEGKQDWASMKVAEKLLKIAPDLETALAALPDWITEDG